MKKITLLIILMATVTFVKAQVSAACNGDPMTGTKALAFGEKEKLITFQIKHTFTITPTANYAPIIKAISFNHAWVKEPVVPCNNAKVKPSTQPGTFKFYGKDTIINSTPYNNLATVDTMVNTIPATGGGKNDSAFSNSCNSRARASTCIVVDSVVDKITGVIQSYGFAQAINPTINTDAYAFSWCGVSVEDGQPLKQGDFGWKPGIKTVAKGKTRNIRQKAGSNDPINFYVHDYTNNSDTSGTLLSIVMKQQIADDTLSKTNYWLNDTVHIESDSILFKVAFTSPFTSSQGFINLLVQNGQVIQSQKTGVFLTVPIPLPGTPVPFSFHFINNLIFHYNLDTSGLFNNDSIHVKLFMFGNNENADTKSYDTTKLVPTPHRPSCNGGSDGAISLYVNYGMSPYTFSWSNGSTNQDLQNVSSGFYSVFVTDFFGATASLATTLADPPLLSVTGIPSNVTCKGARNGTITVTASGGTPAYTYLWNNGNTKTSRTGLGPNTYTVTVTDSKGCTVSNAFIITEPTALTIATSKSNVRCNGACNGSVALSVTGGISPYSFIWSNGSTTSSITTLCAGSYTCTITDANNCSKTKALVITEPSVLSLSVTPGTSNDATAFASGGTPPYVFKWFTVPVQTTATATGLVGGNVYKVKVTDFKSCTATIFFTMPLIRMADDDPSGEDNLVVFPNPVNDILNISLGKAYADGCKIEIVDVMGRIVYQEMAYRKDESINISSYNEGLYLIKTTFRDRVIVKRVMFRSDKNEGRSRR